MFDKRRIRNWLTDIFGRTSWSASGPSVAAPIPQSKKAQHILIFIENRAVIYMADNRSDYQPCVQSVLEIRTKVDEFIVEVDKECGSDTDLVQYLRQLRAGCRIFRQQVEEITASAVESGDPAAWGAFNRALGQLRHVFAVALGQMIVQFDLEWESQLESLWPDLFDKDNDKEFGHRITVQ